MQSEDNWKNLNTPELDHRLFLIAGYLLGKTEDKTILDLNCGAAPLYWKLFKDFEFYLATDKFPIKDAPKDRPRFKFKRMLDHTVSTYLRTKGESIDILLALGYAARQDIKESTTLPDTIIELCSTHTPEYVVLDAWDRLPGRCGLGQTMGMLTKQGYSIECSWLVRPKGTIFSVEAERQIYILKGVFDVERISKS